MSLHVQPATEVEICANLWLTLFDLLLSFSAAKANIWLLHTGTTGYSSNPFNNFFACLVSFFPNEQWFAFCECVLFERSKWSLDGINIKIVSFLPFPSFVCLCFEQSFVSKQCKRPIAYPFFFFSLFAHSSLTDAVLMKHRGVFSTKSKMVDDERDSHCDMCWKQPNRKRQTSNASILPSVVAKIHGNRRKKLLFEDQQFRHRQNPKLHRQAYHS